MRTRERTFFMTEQLALQKRLRNGVAIDGDKRTVLARALAVNGHGGHFLARSAFPQQQDRRGNAGNFSHGRKHILDLRAVAEHALESADGQAVLNFAILALQLRDIKRAL